MLQMIIRNLARRKMRSAVTAGGVALAVAAMFSMLAFMLGYQRGMRGELDRLGAHVLVVPKGCPYDAASIALHGANWPCYLKQDYVKTVQDTPHVAVAAPVYMSAVYDSATGAQTVFCGVTREILGLKREWKIDGEFPSASGDLLVGSETAKDRDWKLGAQVTLPGLDGASGRISGIIRPTQGADDLFIYMPLQDVQSQFKRPHQITHMLVRLDSPESMESVVNALRSCGAGLEMNVVPLAHLFSTINNLVQGTRFLLGCVALIALLAAGAGLSNTILMAVAERTREIGVLRAIGASRLRVFGLILGETLALCVIGGAAGIAAAIIGSRGIEAWLRGRLPFTPDGTLIQAQPLTVALCLLVAAAVGCLAGLLPAWRACRLAPVAAIQTAGGAS